MGVVGILAGLLSQPTEMPASGEGAAALLARSNAILARPAEITLLDVIAHKPGEPGL